MRGFPRVGDGALTRQLTAIEAQCGPGVDDRGLGIDGRTDAQRTLMAEDKAPPSLNARGLMHDRPQRRRDESEHDRLTIERIYRKGPWQPLLLTAIFTGLRAPSFKGCAGPT